MQKLMQKKDSTENILIDNQLFTSQNVNELIIKERNEEIKNLERDLVDLRDSMEILSSMLGEQGEALDVAEAHVEETVITTNEAVQIIEQIPDKKQVLVRNIKIISGVIVGGALLGGVGSIFGIIPAVVGAGIGSGGGAIVGYISDLLK